ncbi:flagellar motor protein MotB [candidate division KSB1 bacterium]|nr:flagellar motor protein MotB [candidate division KSB1 bacterium]TDI91282.1 MAG: flagellar motor protein MotB [Caldithrix sp.]
MSDEKKKPEEEDDAPSSPAWMATFADMMTLLMCFFILILSFSSIELDKFKMAMGSLQGALGTLGVQKKLLPDQSWFSPNTQNTDQIKENSILDHIEKMREQIKKEGLEDKISIEEEGGEVYIQMKDDMMFQSGKAELKPTYFNLLSLIAKTFLADAKQIRVEGHTDNIPIQTKEYQSNWELSIQRALNVVRYFVNHENIHPAKLIIAGYGEHKPIAANDSPSNRAKNRRVLLNVKY